MGRAVVAIQVEKDYMLSNNVFCFELRFGEEEEVENQKKNDIKFFV